MKLVIDRFEGDYAVCEKEDRIMIDIEKSKLPSDAKEGDVIVLIDGKYSIDLEETNKRKKEIEKLIDDLWE
ncbi:DUF3006 domain-containing protein [Maledivibacter halophilus]|uniref:Uncharacterized protein n=1 Tax=Maledivibacter halophilus TaxID=36842 RepID=A0A1T5MFG6_9FIRM|nr:DUF3006 domain-containing protein [Maledivibacter halophilus]SKC86996.1 Protein of unknown function [Maledivibacter halophilus]